MNTERALLTLEYDENTTDLLNSVVGIKGKWAYWTDDPMITGGGSITFTGTWQTTVSLGDSQATIEAAAQVEALARINLSYGGYTTISLVSTDLKVIAQNFAL